MTEWLTSKQLARRIGRDERTLRNLTKSGMPVDRSGSRPRYDWDSVRPWWEENLRARSPSAEEARTRREMAQAELAEYELAEKRQNMISIEDHSRILGRILERLRAKHLNVPGKWAPQVVGLRTIAEGQLRLEKMMHECLLELSRVGDEIEEDDDTYSPQHISERAPSSPPKQRRRRKKAARPTT